MKELSDPTEKQLIDKHKRHRTCMIHDSDKKKDSERIISYPQNIFYKTEKNYKMRYKKSDLSSRYYSEILQKYIDRLLDDRR